MMWSYSRFRRFAVELLRISPVPASIGAKGEECQDCRFWKVAGCSLDGWMAGECRRRAPTEGRNVGGAIHPRWPLTQSRSWCGEFERR